MAIVDLLREAEALAVPSGEGYFARKFEVTYNKGTSVKRFFVAIAIDAFRTTPLEFRRRRDGYLQEICAGHLFMSQKGG